VGDLDSGSRSNSLSLYYTVACYRALLEGTDLPDSSPMTTSYNSIAGQNVERLAALSDGIFAVAMTLLVLDRVPATEGRS
jgi:hypothetical protein